jgi:hypothetical protein
MSVRPVFRGVVDRAFLLPNGQDGAAVRLADAGSFAAGLRSATRRAPWSRSATSVVTSGACWGRGARGVSVSSEPLHLVWFAGGGGSSCGAKMHLGRDVDYALNHDAVALRMHEVNHPGTIHMCADAFAAEPEELEHGRPIGTMWFSPDCTHHSVARGSAPKSERIRGLCWCILPWARRSAEAGGRRR